MSADLTTLLTQAEDELERSVAASDDALAGRLHGAVARRRRVRHVRETAGGLAVAAVLGVGSWAAAGTWAPAPTVSTPTPTVTSEPAPSPSPTPETSPEPQPTQPAVPAAPAVREAEIDDATVLARQQAPRTGEVWSTPEPAPEMEATLAPGDGTSVWRVGRRGDSTIYVTVDQDAATNGGSAATGPSVGVLGLYEVDARGARAVVCPSARTGDRCVDAVPDGTTRDEATFYDTMTLPRAVELATGWRLTTTATTSRDAYAWTSLGDARPLYGRGGTVEVVAELGGADVVEVTSEGQVDGLSEVRYAIRTPYGALVDVAAEDAPSGEFGLIRWDDGVARPVPDDAWSQSTSPSGGACFAGTFSVEDRHVAADWRAAGTTPGGHRVYVPVPGGNAASRAVHAWQAEASFDWDDATGGIVQGPAAYAFGDHAAFLAGHALYAIQGPTGEWQLRLRGDAVQTVYECA